MQNKKTLMDYILLVVMALVIVVTLYPFLNVLAISLNDAVDTAKGGLHIWPRKFTLANYMEVFSRNKQLLRAFVNSVLRTVIGTGLGLMSSTMLAYTLSRKDFIFRKSISRLLVLTMYVSGGLIPSYMLIRKLGLINNFWVYIIPSLLNAYNVIVIRSFIEDIPDSIEESARIDGASDFTIFYKIILPLSIPVLATVALFIAVGQWNSWFDTYLYARNNPKLTTLQYELMKILDNANAQGNQLDPNNPLLQQAKTTPESIKMAITVIATVPIIVTYPFLQKYFVSGIVVGAVKE